METAGGYPEEQPEQSPRDDDPRKKDSPSGDKAPGSDDAPGNDDGTATGNPRSAGADD